MFPISAFCLARFSSINFLAMCTAKIAAINADTSTNIPTTVQITILRDTPASMDTDTASNTSVCW